MVKCCVFFAVRTEFLNVIWTVFGFKGLTALVLYIITGTITLAPISLMKQCFSPVLKVPVMSQNFIKCPRRRKAKRERNTKEQGGKEGVKGN
jgi:hypothetical protein